MSYLTAWPSSEATKAARQRTTREWWQERRSDFELFVSQVVVDEAGAGDPEAAASRLERIRELPRLGVTSRVTALAKDLVAEGAIPPGSTGDAFHVALAAAHGMNFLLTWNCSHIANAEREEAIREVVEAAGYVLPVICTPEEMKGELE